MSLILFHLDTDGLGVPWHKIWIAGIWPSRTQQAIWFSCMLIEFVWVIICLPNTIQWVASYKFNSFAILTGRTEIDSKVGEAVSACDSHNTQNCLKQQMKFKILLKNQNWAISTGLNVHIIAVYGSLWCWWTTHSSPSSATLLEIFWCVILCILAGVNSPTKQ